eukprot:TRINITY_DN43956_c0_g1_i1.p1 TRINITY_DN43956_c0_g1~~TRINITY_DN43956_c0_g1_i1.p1  ORF type:complete len:434 (-),score=86.70 TRINITY_DN43956_c0_g1_i1:348-1649(-)
MASLLAAPLDEGEIEDLVSLFPDFTGEVPEDAKYWAKSDLELFLGSNGQLRPRDVAPKAGVVTCPLLSRARQLLAELKVGEATTEYRSWCRHLAERGGLRQAEVLQTVASCSPVQRAERATAVPKVPLVVPRPKQWCGSSWNLDFWQRECRSEWWKARSRSPSFENDRKPADCAALEGGPAEFVDYAKVLQQMDPDCKEDNAMAFPRFTMDAFTAFHGAGRPLLERHWQELSPAGIRDLSPRWIKMFTNIFRLEWMDFLPRFYKISLGAPGSITRLHVSNHGAHSWHTQIEGRRLFFLFSPQETGNLYEEEGRAPEHVEGHAHSVSAVDIFHPNAKRHGRFAGAKAQHVTLCPGETLVIPSGWWHYSVHLEASVTLHHPFWGVQNRARMSEELREAFAASTMPQELVQMAAQNISQLHQRIMADDDDDSDIDV